MAWPRPALMVMDRKTMGIATAIAQKVAIFKRFQSKIISTTMLIVEFTHIHLKACCTLWVGCEI